MSDAREKAVELMAKALARQSATKWWAAPDDSGSAILRNSCIDHANEAFDALLAAYPQIARAMEPGMWWQPIATARRDGNAIMLCAGKTVGSGRWRNRHALVDTSKDFYFDGASMPSCATHWMPLPEHLHLTGDAP